MKNNQPARTQLSVSGKSRPFYMLLALNGESTTRYVYFGYIVFRLGTCKAPNLYASPQQALSNCLQLPRHCPAVIERGGAALHIYPRRGSAKALNSLNTLSFPTKWGLGRHNISEIIAIAAQNFSIADVVVCSTILLYILRLHIRGEVCRI